MKKPHLIRRLYDWVLHWAHTPYGTPALAALATAESSFFPVPPDPLLMALAMSRPERSLWYALVCSASSATGGMLGYLIGWQLWHVVSDFFFTHVPGFTPEVFNLVAQKYNDNAFLAVFTAAFTPIPYKVFTIAGGVFQINFAEFVAASIVGRSLRFFLVAGLIRVFGAAIKEKIDRYFDWFALGFTVLLILGFLVIKYAL
ncbi:MAG: VTT domain-containing protein [candidate division KSB1 bacterium]|nr:VTT domain-containing protein [candidate division KSB1 bacterium]MDZ7273730.1 VTT domain-containing protein [candidate division KSB1 bacterium]MDZ7285886.1 VTT domain-containing protein [candidate division KSB1 bacterium]MDZ7298918.1 VTT domain-containing protein [candidate division KSB1 bacterium]MDZ7307904.1 VTT domain-containing protein [candidate division KSB1 bacterium]